MSETPTRGVPPHSVHYPGCDLPLCTGCAIPTPTPGGGPWTLRPLRDWRVGWFTLTDDDLDPYAR